MLYIPCDPISYFFNHLSQDKYSVYIILRCPKDIFLPTIPVIIFFMHFLVNAPAVLAVTFIAELSVSHFQMHFYTSSTTDYSPSHAPFLTILPAISSRPVEFPYTLHVNCFCTLIHKLINISKPNHIDIRSL